MTISLASSLQNLGISEFTGLAISGEECHGRAPCAGERAVADRRIHDGRISIGDADRSSRGCAGRPDRVQCVENRAGERRGELMRQLGQMLREHKQDLATSSLGKRARSHRRLWRSTGDDRHLRLRRGLSRQLYG